MNCKMNSLKIQASFNGAWRCIPRHISLRLEGYIREIEEVENIEGLYINRPDGTRFGPLDNGVGSTFGYGYLEGYFLFYHVILSRSQLEDFAKGHAIASILFQLAHAYLFCCTPREHISGREADRKAWATVTDWTHEGITDERLLRAVVDYATIRIKELRRRSQYQCGPCVTGKLY